jgi:hypothetical protein
MDGTVATDAPRFDGPVPDAPVPDGAGTDAPPPDGFVVIPDGGPPCMGTDRCSCTRKWIPCGAGGTCPAGSTCLDTTCGEMACLIAGGLCDTDADCPSTSVCVDYACSRGTPGCTDSRECARGFACESGSCVDRRVPCINNVDCPWGYYCRVLPAGSYCEYIHRGCDSGSVCFLLGTCGDMDDDGDGDCVGSAGSCDSTADCSGGQVCGTHPTLTRNACGSYGACTGTCPSGFVCQDLWGDGQRMCVPTGGSCDSTSDCPVRQVCAAPVAGGPPECIVGRAM